MSRNQKLQIYQTTRQITGKIQ